VAVSWGGRQIMSTSTTETVFFEPLTARERQVAEAIARGLTNKQIAMEFGISAETVKRHLASIYGKLALHGRLALAIHVLRSRAA
jgi:DNA-binding NarL/FixJ family response regulator